MAVDSTASRQWASRPDDERYLNLESLRAAVADRTIASRQDTVNATGLHAKFVQPTKESPAGDILLEVDDKGVFRMNHWSFGQACAIARAPQQYMRDLHPALAEKCLNYGLLTHPRGSHMVLFNNDTREMRAMTSKDYGRIWDLQVVDAVMQLNAAQDGIWHIPAASYRAKDPKRATTLYASDRDVFIFLVDDQHPVEHGNTTLFRGFYVWNSEVGHRVFGISAFLYEYVCDNRNIWGVQNQVTVKFKHTQYAPERFLTEAGPALNSYQHASVAPLIASLKKAKAFPVGANDQEVLEWIMGRGFTKTVAQRIQRKALEEHGQCENLWDVVWGGTAMAREMVHTDSRIDAEAKVSQLMDRYATV